MTRQTIACPECGNRRCEVIDSREIKEGDTIRRRRKCENGHRFTTKERIDQGDAHPQLKEPTEIVSGIWMHPQFA